MKFRIQESKIQRMILSAGRAQGVIFRKNVTSRTKCEQVKIF
jgi:hypothetical protein